MSTGTCKNLMAARHKLEFAAISCENNIGNKTGRYLLPNQNAVALAAQFRRAAPSIAIYVRAQVNRASWRKPPMTHPRRPLPPVRRRRLRSS